jgi:Nickel responsive protein SCO4226-like
MLYAAKCYWPGVTEEEVKGSVAGMSRDGTPVRYLGSLLFAGDDLVLCLFDAGSAPAARDASEQAGLPCERVMEAVWLVDQKTERSS